MELLVKLAGQPVLNYKQQRRSMYVTQLVLQLIFLKKLLKSKLLSYMKLLSALDVKELQFIVISAVTVLW